MQIVYVKHFWKQFADRRRHSPVPLTMELVGNTIRNPDFIMQDPKYPEREWRIRKIAGRCFKVIVERDGEKIVAITLMFDRILRRKGLCK